MDKSEADERLIAHGLQIEAMEKMLEYHTKEIASLAKNQNRLLIALIIVTLVGSDTAQPIILKLLGA
jgi:hypothetical protein